MTKTHGPNGYLSIAEAAKRLGVARGTVHRMISQDQLSKRTVALRDYVPQRDIDLFLTTKLATQVSTGIVLELLDLFDRHPELLAQLRALVDEGGTS
ncbi:MAG TPA: helix-turn-helix domain-containing protein [Jiangellaceae bacterium]|nr:helix-turn-helix domain-containing protein [Jiangellaceae bacterium]